MSEQEGFKEGMEKPLKTPQQVCTKKVGLTDLNLVGVHRTENGQLWLCVPEGFLLTLQTSDFMKYKVTPKKI